MRDCLFEKIWVVKTNDDVTLNSNNIKQLKSRMKSTQLKNSCGHAQLSGKKFYVLKYGFCKKSLRKNASLTSWTSFRSDFLQNPYFKGQLISKANCQAVNSSKKRTNEFVFTSMRRVFVRFLEESLARKITFRDYLTFSYQKQMREGIM